MDYRTEPRPTTLWVAALYLILGGLIQLLAQILVISRSAGEALEVYPLWILAAGYVLTLCRIFAGAMLLSGRSRAVIACLQVVGAWLLWRGSAGARALLLAAVLAWVAALPLAHLPIYVGLAFAACAFLLAVHKVSRDAPQRAG